MGTNRAIVPRRPDISFLILTISGLAYAVLCVPAIKRARLSTNRPCVDGDDLLMDWSFGALDAV